MPVVSPYAARLAAVPVRRTELTLRGATTSLWTYGEPDAPRRMVLLHGLRGDHHGLEPIVAHLAAPGSGRQVMLPDLPGFGASPPLPADRHDLAGYRAWTHELVAALAADRAGDGLVLAGHSFGSIVVAAAAAADPRSVRALVLINPIATSALAGPRQAMTRLTVGYHRLAAALPDAWGTALLRLRLLTRIASVAMVVTPDRELRRWIHAEHDRRFAGFADRRSLLQAFHTSIRHDVAESAPRIDLPTLLVAAERDDIAPVPAQQALLARFADARLVVVPGVGHLAHYEAPAAVAEAVAAFG